MSDLLVKLYELPECDDLINKLKQEGIIIKRAIAPEKSAVSDWVTKHFNKCWASECEVAFAHEPVGCILAVKEGQLLGFACYDSTVKGFFGPTGVDEKYRGKGIGKALLLKALKGLYDNGYAYGIIGSAGPVDFYKKVVGAIEIENSSPGIYKDMVR